MINNNVYLQIKGEYQDVITHEDGTVEVTESHNLIVDDVYKLIAILLGRRTGYAGLQFWAVGKGLDTWSNTNTPDPSEEDSRLVNEIGRVPITRMYHVNESHKETSKVTNRLAVEVKFGKNDCNGTWREFGIFGGNANPDINTGIMINHKTHGAIKKTDQMEITRRIVFTFTNGLEVEIPEPDIPEAEIPEVEVPEQEIPEVVPPEESEPERVTHMPIIQITGDLDPLNRGESSVMVDLRLEDGLGHAIFEKKAVVEYQNYSASDKKHNYNIDLLELDGDTKYEPALTYGFSGKTWVAQDGYTLKANTTDVTQAHNIVAVNIIHKSYKKPLVARSCIDGFPCEMYINNVYHGLYTWNLKQHRDVYGLKKPTTTERKNHLMFRGKWSDSDSPSNNIVSPVNFRTLSTSNSDTGADNKDWEDRHPKAYRNYPELVEENRGKLNRLISFVKDTPVESFKTRASEYFDLEYLIDYYVWCYFGGFTDSLSNNFNIVTTNGQVWYTTFYDLDASFGRNHTGTAILPSNLAFPTGYRCATSLLWEKVGTAFEQEIKQRYAELRATTMNPEYIMRELRRFECMITEEAYARDLEKWSTLSGRNLGLDQIQTWLEKRVTYCDPIFDYQS